MLKFEYFRACRGFEEAQVTDILAIRDFHLGPGQQEISPPSTRPNI